MCLSANCMWEYLCLLDSAFTLVETHKRIAKVVVFFLSHVTLCRFASKQLNRVLSAHFNITLLFLSVAAFIVMCLNRTVCIVILFEIVVLST